MKWLSSGVGDVRRIQIVRSSTSSLYTKKIDIVALASGLIIDTSSAFATPTLGTRKTEPKSRYSLVLQAAQSFDSELRRL